MRQRIVAVCGSKNTGKTTLIEGLVRDMAARGLKVAVIKHDGHDFDCDVPGTDSHRFTAAGAYAVAVYSAHRMFLHRIGTGEGAPELREAFPEADVILVEGLKDSDWPKIEVVRAEIGMGPVSNPQGRFLLVTDLPPEGFREPAVSFEDREGILRAILDAEPGKSPEKEAGEKMEFSHFDSHGNAWMVDVSEKADTAREAVAAGRIRMSEACFEKVQAGGMEKGDVLGVARTAGIMGAKQTSSLIPLCHILLLTKVAIDFDFLPRTREIEAVCRVKTTGKTGVEMEALTGVSVALLTIYDMCKAVDKSMEIGEIRLLRKSGGKSGDYVRNAVSD